MRSHFKESLQIPNGLLRCFGGKHYLEFDRFCDDTDHVSVIFGACEIELSRGRAKPKHLRFAKPYISIEIDMFMMP